MSTSIHNGRVLFADSLYGSADTPVDTTIMRDGVANGLLHIADSYAQVRVAVMHPDYSTFGGAAEFEYNETLDNTPTANTWYRIQGSPFGEWPLTMHADGTPYVLRVRVGGKSSGGAGAGTVTFRVVIAPASNGLGELELPADHIYETAGTTSTSVAWLTGASRGSGAYTTRMELAAAKADTWTREVSVYNAVSEADSRQVRQCLVACHVFAKTTNALDVPRLHALSVAEYVGL
jgi:hypothetical protein